MNPLLPEDPEQVGRYRLEGRLGNGSSGTVYLGRTPGGRPAAVKVLRQTPAWDPQAVERFQREAEVLRTVHSAYTTTLIDSELTDPPFWLATEYIPGPTLTEAIAEHGAVPAREAMKLMASLAEGLGDLHAHGILHRDVKPQNVILSPTGPRLIDFGIAQAATQNRLTETGITIGTPHYTAPELFDDVELTPAVDIFALGATIAYAASGRHPHGNGTMASIIKRMLFEEVDLDGLDPNLADLLKSCMAADPSQRPSIDQIIEICRRGPSDNTVPVAAAPAVVRSIEAPPTVIRPVETPVKRRRVLWLWPALAGLALLVGGGVVAAQRPGVPDRPAGQVGPIALPASSLPSPPASTRPSVRPSLKPTPTPPRTTPPKTKPPRTSAPAPKPTTTRPATPSRTSASPVFRPRVGQLKDSSGECADNRASNTTDGNRLQRVPCNGSAAQEWTARTDGRLEVQSKCMTVAGNSTAHGSRVVLMTCGKARSQIWRAQPDGTLRNPASGRCLDVLAPKDTALILYDCVGRVTQQWRGP